MTRQAIQLGGIQETLLIPLYARAVETRKKRALIDDPKAAGIVESIDWNFRRFSEARRVFACVLRTAMFDEWVKDFLARNPEGTVVEIGAGLNTRFERLDNGRLHWLDLDLPDATALRRKFFADTGRRINLSGSVLERGWVEEVRRSPGPYFFVAEAVFVYLREDEVKDALGRIARDFPGSIFAFDTATGRAVNSGNEDFARKRMQARFSWACSDPREIEGWNLGLRLVVSRTMADVPAPLNPKVPFLTRTILGVIRVVFPKVCGLYRLNLFVAAGPA